MELDGECGAPREKAAVEREACDAALALELQVEEYANPPTDHANPEAGAEATPKAAQLEESRLALKRRIGAGESDHDPAASNWALETALERDFLYFIYDPVIASELAAVIIFTDPEADADARATHFFKELTACGDALGHRGVLVLFNFADVHDGVHWSGVVVSGRGARTYEPASRGLRDRHEEAMHEFCTKLVTLEGAFEEHGLNFGLDGWVSGECMAQHETMACGWALMVSVRRDIQLGLIGRRLDDNV
jgi:hypothetical protein